MKILITGAAGYIGGSLVLDLVNSDFSPKIQIIATTRTPEQAQELIARGVNAITLDLTDSEVTTRAVVENDVDVVLHMASSHDPDMAAALIKGLGQLKRNSGNPRYFIHTSGTTGFVAETGWQGGDQGVSDLDDVYTIEKRSANQEYNVRTTDIRVIEESMAHGIPAYIIVVPSVYGRGTGGVRNLSIALPIYIRAAIKTRAVGVFNQDGKPAAVHISDLLAFYRLLLSSISSNDKKLLEQYSYYFPIGHFGSSQDTMRRLAIEMHSLGLVNESDAKPWTDDEEAGKALGVPTFIARMMGTQRVNLKPVKAASELGWKPKWTIARFFDNIKDEILHVVDVDGVEMPTLSE